MLFAAANEPLPTPVILTIIGINVLIFGGMYFFFKRQAKQLEALRQQTLVEGVPLQGRLVMANNDAFKTGGGDDLPACVIFSFPGDNEATAEELDDLAGRLFDLRTRKPADPAEKAAKKILGNDSFRAGYRAPLAPEFAGGREVYLADIGLDREFMPAGYLTEMFVRLRARPGATGVVYHAPPSG